MMKVLRFSFLLVLCMLLIERVHAQAPVITNLSPIDNAEGISPQVNLVMSFDMPVQKGSGTVQLRNVEDDAVIEILDVQSTRIQLAGNDNSSVIIDPTNNFDPASAYYVLIDNGAFVSLDDAAFAGLLEKTAWNFTTGCGSAPTNVVGTATSNIAILEWDAVPGVSDYQVWVSNGLGIFYTNGNNFFDLENLPPGTTYDWSVRSVCYISGKRILGPAVYKSFTTRGTNPCAVAPTNLTVNFDEQTNETILSWDFNANVVDYQVWVNNGIGVHTVSGTNSFRTGGLTAGATFSWGVKSRCINNGKSVFSSMAVSEFTTPGTIPCASAPENLVVDFNEETNETILSWDFNADVLDYQIWVNNGVGVYMVNGTNNYRFAGLPAGTTYIWGVKSRCINNGKSVYSETTVSEFTTPGANPCAEAPANVEVNFDEGTNETILSWDFNAEVLDYQVWVNNGVGVFTVDGSNSFRLEGLPSGTTFTWGVKSRCINNGKSVYSNMTVSEFTTPGESPCATAPVNLTVDFDEQTNETILTWDPKDDVLDYQVWVNNGIGVYFTNGANSYRIENLSPETTYTWGVKSRCISAGRSTFSSMTVSEFTTPDFIEDGEIFAAPNMSLYNNQQKLAKEAESVPENFFSVSIYPNPTVDVVNLVLSSDELISALIVRNGEGSILEKLDEVNLSSQAISLGRYGTGIYIINIITNSGKVLTKKVIVN